MNSRNKGKRGELEWRDVIRSHGYEARRGQQFSGSPDSPDVVTDLPYHFEVGAYYIVYSIFYLGMQLYY